MGGEAGLEDPVTCFVPKKIRGRPRAWALKFYYFMTLGNWIVMVILGSGKPSWRKRHLAKLMSEGNEVEGAVVGWK